MTLTILAMKRTRVIGETSTPTFSFDYYIDIWKKANAMSGRDGTEPFVSSKAPLHYFIHTISPLGAAVREGSDGKTWQLTHFGEAIKPLLIWAQKEMDKEDISSIKLLGDQSTKTEISNVFTGQTEIITPAIIRFRILSALLFASIEGKKLEAHEMVELFGMARSSLSQAYLEPLKATGFITYDSMSQGRPMTYYSITKLGEKTLEWESLKSRRAESRRLYEAFVEITDGDTKKSVTYTDMQIYYKDKGWKYDVGRTGNVLTHFGNHGFIKKALLHEKHRSEIGITERGKIALSILSYVYLWSQDPRIIPDISSVQLTYKERQKLYGNMANLFRRDSGNANGNPEVKLRELMSMIYLDPGKTSNGYARDIEKPITTIAKLSKVLLQSGLLTTLQPIEEKKYMGNPLFTVNSVEDNNHQMTEEEIENRIAIALREYREKNQRKSKTHSS